jgi:alpha/beta superfamily hydrolase
MSESVSWVVFSHGLDSVPWGAKIVALAEIAKAKGFQVESVDYTQLRDPEERVAKLLAECPSGSKKLVLVGSSMGAYVSAVASKTLKPDGLFLLAAAFFIPRYAQPSPKPNAKHTELIHGWRDDVIPPENAFRYAQEHGAQLHLIDGDHRLTEALPFIERQFSAFLDAILADA